MRVVDGDAVVRQDLGGQRKSRRLAVKLKSLVSLIPLVAMMACSYTVPLTREAAIDTPPNPKYEESILLVMSAEEAQRIVEYSPQLGDTYVFQAGPALKDLLLSVLGQLYAGAAYAESTQQAQTSYDLAVEARLTSHQIVMNVRKGHTVTLGIDYSVYDPQGNIVEKIPTNSSSTDKFSGGEKLGVYTLMPLYAIGKNKDKVGVAWDTAALNSIGVLLEKLREITE
jgi:hypothetical protein